MDFVSRHDGCMQGFISTTTLMRMGTVLHQCAIVNFRGEPLFLDAMVTCWGHAELSSDQPIRARRVMYSSPVVEFTTLQDPLFLEMMATYWGSQDAPKLTYEMLSKYIQDEKKVSFGASFDSI